VREAATRPVDKVGDLERRPKGHARSRVVLRHGSATGVVSDSFDDLLRPFASVLLRFTASHVDGDHRVGIPLVATAPDPDALVHEPLGQYLHPLGFAAGLCCTGTSPSRKGFLRKHDLFDHEAHARRVLDLHGYGGVEGRRVTH